MGFHESVILGRTGLRAGMDHADVLILGYFSRRPSRRLIDGAQRMKEKGLVRFVGTSSHNRKLLGELARCRARYVLPVSS